MSAFLHRCLNAKRFSHVPNLKVRFEKLSPTCQFAVSHLIPTVTSVRSLVASLATLSNVFTFFQEGSKVDLDVFNEIVRVIAQFICCPANLLVEGETGAICLFNRLSILHTFTNRIPMHAHAHTAHSHIYMQFHARYTHTFTHKKHSRHTYPITYRAHTRIRTHGTQRTHPHSREQLKPYPPHKYGYVVTSM